MSEHRTPPTTQEAPTQGGQIPGGESLARGPESDRFPRRVMAGFIRRLRDRQGRGSEEHSSMNNEVYTLLNEMVSEGSIQHAKQEIDEELQDPTLAQIGAIEQDRLAVVGDSSEAFQEKDYGRVKLFDQKIAELEGERDSFPANDRDRYYDLVGKRHALENKKEVDIPADDERAKFLLAQLTQAPHVAPINTTQEAPFAHYAENDGLTSVYVSDETIARYVEGKRFFDTTYLSTEDGQVTIRADRGENFEVPMDLMVYAKDYESWKGRKRDKEWNSPVGSGRMSSPNVIKHYASLPTELPPVDRIQVFVQPDGVMFCDNGAGDSHRIGAALLRGDETIKANSVSFIPIDQNILDSPTAVPDGGQR